MTLVTLRVFNVTGYRHIGLRNECNQPQGAATLFVHISVKDYIPDAFAGIVCYFDKWLKSFNFGFSLHLLNLCIRLTGVTS